MQHDTEHSEYILSTDQSRLDVDAIVSFLSERSSWAMRCSRAVIEESLRHSLCFGIYHKETGAQAAFARAVTDYTTFAWIADVFVLEAHRGRGLSKWLMETITSIPELANVARMWLATGDAHGLYEQYGFVRHPEPHRVMVLRRKPP